MTVAQQQQRSLGQQTGLVQQQQQAQQLANQQLINDANRMGMYNQPSAIPTAGQAQQQQQSIQQQQMIQQATAQLQQQQSIIQHQHQQLLMMNTNQEYMQMQHQAQHSKKLRKMTGQTAALEQQLMVMKNSHRIEFQIWNIFLCR